MTLLVKGARVIVRTTNGGEAIGYLARDYEPTYRVEFIPDRGTPFWIEAARIKSIAPFEDYSRELEIHRARYRL